MIHAIVLGLSTSWDSPTTGTDPAEVTGSSSSRRPSDRFSRAVRSIDSWCRENRHLPLREQQQKLNQKLRGHYAYYGVTCNSAALSRIST